MISLNQAFFYRLIFSLPISDFETPSTTVTATKEELIQYLKEMYTMRRVEITNDTEYKVKFFNNLHDGYFPKGAQHTRLLPPL
jgi:hypothetical protein